jgi:DNA polymerase elongation subunit (family B)
MRLAVLDFDVECRPLAWYGGDFVTKQPTAIAWQWVGQDGTPRVEQIGLSDRSSLVLEEEAEMIETFRHAYNQADVVTGHYLRGFDLPLLNGACDRLGLSPLAAKHAQDTKIDYMRAQGISKSMENLGAMYELKHPKVIMNTALWAAGNMLLPEGLLMTRKRVVGDVKEHIELREQMLRRGTLGAGTVYDNGAGDPTLPAYIP